MQEIHDKENESARERDREKQRAEKESRVEKERDLHIRAQEGPNYHEFMIN